VTRLEPVVVKGRQAPVQIYLLDDIAAS
jgi:hypothetical protein